MASDDEVIRMAHLMHAANEDNRSKFLFIRES